jgi:hypothetical protein
MKHGITPYSNDPEAVFQAFRLRHYAVKKGRRSKYLSISEGVEYEEHDIELFKVSEQINCFLDQEGRTYSCTSCVNIGKKGGSEVYPLPPWPIFIA